MKSTGVRLQKIIARSGRASRREAEKLIVSGKVTVNDITVTELGTRAIPGVDIIKVNGEEIRTEELTYMVLYKPRFCVTTMKDPQNRRCIGDLLKKWPVRLYPVGRLDYDAEGLLMCTNDGELSYRLQHPKFGVEKVYEVKLSGNPSREALRKLLKGVKLEEGIARADKLKLIRYTERNCWIQITLHQGWNRQIKRMGQAIGHPVLKIKRIGYGPLTLAGLRAGESRILTQNEVKTLYEKVGLRYGKKVDG
ncbi:MAG: pseudouridine synthase [Deltaproteobacteria bacterium]|nr:MAG: pseudouridine synthase [Deltaproteobacteria bacterium]